MLEEVEGDQALQKIRKDLEADQDSHPAFTLEHDQLHQKGRLFLSAKSEWIPNLIAEIHVTTTGGHSRVYRTYRKVVQSLYWVGMKKAIMDFVAACMLCHQHKYLASSPQGLIQPLPIPQAIWEDINMDFIVSLLKSNGYDTVLVMVDRLRKYGHFIPHQAPLFSQDYSRGFRELFIPHQAPSSIVSDRDPTFLILFWKELFRLQGTKLLMSTDYHLETNGQKKVLNRTLKTYLRCFNSESQKLEICACMGRILV